MTVVAVSGGFDPLHPGHLRMFIEAKKLGDKLVVIMNNDNWLRHKKRFAFMPETERKEILEGVRGVDAVMLTEHVPDDPDRSVCRELAKLKPDIFANGGDRTNENTPEMELCDRLGITLVFGVGGGKVESSSSLVQRVFEKYTSYPRPWGHYCLYAQGDGWALKTLHVLPNQATSLQSHTLREEYWTLVAGGATATLDGKDVQLRPFEPLHIATGAKHRLRGGPEGGILVEIMRGAYDENDIRRFEDMYGRS